MARTVTWLNDDNKTCVLTIVDDNSNTVALTPAAEPFTTSIQESDDLFTPIRSSNGYIRIVVDNVDSIADLVGAAPIDRAVYLSVNSNARWKGFLACESFTQAWDRGPIEIELPVVSPLEVARGIYPSSALDNLGYINFAQFLINMNTALGVGFTTGLAWSRFYFPVLSETPDTLQYQFDMKNYATAIDKNTKHEVASYYEILEDICKLFGWQAIEYEHELVFLAADKKCYESGSTVAYRGYNHSKMQNIANGSYASPSDTVSFNAHTPIIFGADHDMSWLAGKKSVEVTGQLNERDETIWNMDVVSQCEYKGSDKAETLGTTSFHYFVKKYESPTGGNIQVTNSIGGVSQPSENVKFVNFKNGNDNAYGGSIGYEKYYYSDDSNGHVILSGSDTWVKRLILRSSPNTASFVSHRIVTNFFYSPSQNARAGAQLDAFLITGTLLYASDRQAFFEKTSGYRYTKVAFKIEGTQTYYWNPNSSVGWSTTYADFLIRSKDGELAEYGYYHNGQTLFVPSIPAPTNIEGQVTLNIISANSTDVESWPGSAYLAYEDLSIKLIAAENTRGALTIDDKEQRMNENQKKIDLNNGFTDSWSRECGLTLAREAVPDSYGVVLNASKAQPSSLYDGKWPEDAMAERANNYFARARRRIRAIVESKNKMLNPMVPYTFTSGGRPYIVMEQTHNWRTDEVRANFFEPEYNSL